MSSVNDTAAGNNQHEPLDKAGETRFGG